MNATQVRAEVNNSVDEGKDDEYQDSSGCIMDYAHLVCLCVGKTRVLIDKEKSE